MTRTAQITAVEIYVRFSSEDHGTGVHETPFDTYREAAGQFVEDVDCVSAMRVAISADGRSIAMSDVTDRGLEALTDMIRNDPGSYPVAPHALVEDAHREILDEAEREAREDADHIRIERAALHP